MSGPVRICRTPADAFAAGWADAEHDAPLTAAEIDRLVALHRRYLRPEAA